jgi:hypothetical protein
MAQPKDDEAGSSEAHSSSRRGKAANRCSTLFSTLRLNGQCLL